MTRFITILSGKGGVGKTTLALNLGAALRKSGNDVIILDANLTAADLGLHLGAASFPVTLTNVIKGENEISDAVYLHPNGFKIIPAGINHSELRHHEADYKKLFEKLAGMSEIVIIDGPAGLGKDAESLLSISDETLVVTNPDIVSATNALKAVKSAEERNSTVLGIVLNRIKGDEHEMDTASIEEFLGVPVIAEIPEDSLVGKARAEKSAVVFSYPDADSSVNFNKLAEKLIGEKPK